MIEVQFDGEEVIATLQNAVAQIGHSHTLWKKIGITAKEGVEENFKNQGVDNEKWAPNKESTIERKTLSGKKGNRTKNGRLSARGKKRAASNRILVGVPPKMSQSIGYEVLENGALVGTNAESEKGFNYPEVMQYGTKDGKIPARPWLALNRKTQENIVNEVKAFVERKLTGK